MKEVVAYIVEDPFGNDVFFTNKEVATQYEDFIKPINEAYGNLIDDKEAETLTHEKAKEYFKVLFNSLKDRFENDVTYHFRRFFNENGTPFDKGVDNEITAIIKNDTQPGYRSFRLRNFVDKISKETPYKNLGCVYDEMAYEVWNTYRDIDYIQKVLGK